MPRQKPANRPPERFVIKYKPHPKQDEFAKAIAGGARVAAYVAGIRSGKSHCAVAEALKQVYIYDRYPNLGWFVSPTYDMSKVMENKFKAFCASADGKSIIAVERRAERSYLLWPRKNRGEFYRVEFKSATEPDHLRGPSLGWIVMDEAGQMSAEVFQICMGRVLDSKGVILITTSPSGKNWLYNDIYQRSLRDPKCVVVHGSTFDNPFIPEEEVAQLKEHYAARSASFAQQEIEGQFVDFEGLVFTHFNRSTHVVRYPEVPDDTEVICGIDWGFNDPFVCVWMAKMGDVWVVLDEYYKPRGLFRDHVERLLNHPLAPMVKRYWCDPSNPQARKEFAHMMRERSQAKLMPARRPDKANTKAGWAEMRARLINNLFAQRRKCPWDAARSIPALVYSEHCRMTAQETSQLCYKRFMALGDDGQQRVISKDGQEHASNALEVIEGLNDHSVDALGYAVFSEVRVYGGLRPHFEEGGGIVTAAAPTPQERLRDEIAARIEIGRRKPSQVRDPGWGV